MKKLLVLILAVAAAVTLAGCSGSSPSGGESETLSGTVTAIYHHDDGDYTSVEITTEDGRVWTIDDYTAPIGISCAISVEGDEIQSITTYTHFD